MMSNRYRASSRRCSILPSSSRIRSTTKRRHNHNPPVMSNIQGMRGKMSKNCLWHACQALFVGLVLFSIGAAMSTLGFIIVATCVLTFEARDSAAKVGPSAYTGGRTATAPCSSAYRARSRSLDVRSVASQTIGESTSTSNAALHIFDKRAFLETFKKFSRTIRTGSTVKEEFHRSPSAPSLLATDAQTSAMATRRALVHPKTANRRAPPSLKHLRQTMSVDYTCTSPFMVPGASGSSSAVKSSFGNVSPRNGASPVNQVNASGSEVKGSQSHITVPHCGAGTSRGRYSRGSSTASADYRSVSFNSDVDNPKASQSNISTGSCEVARSSRRVSLPFGPGTHYSGYRSSNLNVHFQPTTVESHLPYVVVTPNTASIEALTTSSNSLRIISPLPSYRSEDSSFDRGSVVSDSVSCGGRSPLPGSRPRLRPELSCRPALIRQPRVDHTEIISVVDSDDELILEEPEVDV